MKKTRIIIFAVLALFLLSTVAGCGQTALQQAPAGTTAATTAAATTAAATTAATTAAADSGNGYTGDLAPYVIDKYELTNSVSADVGMVCEAINAIIEPKFNATINIHMVPWGDWWTVVNTMLAAGEKADIVFTADWWQYPQSIANNYFMPLNDLMEKHGKQMMDQLGDVFITGSQFKGVNYGVPTDKELAVNGGFLWNKTLADKYGLEPDPGWKSYTDWIPLLEVIQENEPDVAPILADGNWYHLDIISYVNADLGWVGYTNDPTLSFIWETDYYKNELYAAREMWNREFIPRDAVAADEDYNNRHLQTGSFFLTTQPLKPAKGKSTELMSQLITHGVVYDEFDTYPLLVNTTHCGGSMLAIPTTSKDPDRAMMYINEMHTNPAVTNLMAWGIEGVHHEVTQAAYPKRVRSIEGNTWTAAMNGWMIGNFFSIDLSSDEPADKYELLGATKVGIPPHVANGYRFDPEDWLDSLTAIDNALKEYRNNLRVGALEVDEGLASMISAAEAAGLRQFEAAVKTDFENWLAAK